MRRVASSLGMRRSTSFFWTPAAHHDFEHAVESLSARGVAITAASLLPLMRHHADLKAADIDKHMHKKMLVQRRLMQQLTPRAPLVNHGAERTPPQPPPLTHRSSGSNEGIQMAPVVEEPSLLVSAAGPPQLSMGEQLERQRQQHRQIAGAQAHMQALAEA